MTDNHGPAPNWRPIETALDYERVLVAGWKPANRNIRGYWWWHEDACCSGVSISHPHATHWFPVIKPAFPEPPKGGM